MAGVNKVILVGNLGRDPEMRYTPSGKAVTNFSLAVSRSFKGNDGENRDETEWFNISCWDRLAEVANQYLAKGRQVYIEGRLRTRQYEDQNGEKRFSLDVTATELQMLGTRGEGAPAGTAGSDNSSFGNNDLDNMPF